MDGIILISIIIIAIVIYLFVCDCIIKQKEKFQNKHQKLYKLDRTGKDDVQIGGYFGNIKDTDEDITTELPLRAISMKDKNEVRRYVNGILRKINKKLGLKFKFVELEHISKQYSDDATLRYLVDVFILETYNQYTKRLILDFTIDFQVSKLLVNNVMIANAENAKKHMKHNEHYFHQPIISINNFENTEDINGFSDSKIPFNKLEYKAQHISDKDFNNWIMPKEHLEEINKELPVWPCRNVEFKWDFDSIHEAEKHSINCKGINSSYTNPNKVPHFLPSMKNIDEKGDYNWLFGKHKTDGRNAFMGGRGHGTS